MQVQPQMRLLFSPEEVGQKLGVSRTVVYGLLNRKELIGVKVGGRRKVSQRAIDLFISQQESIASGSFLASNK
jgi:excisionase family DNA binding protein